jgi:outer membrane lipoprotein carrier protein
MKNIPLLFLLFFYVSFGGEVFKSLEKKLTSCNYIEAPFHQKTRIEGLDEKENTGFTGKLYISKPDKIKIEYTEPLHQIIFVEGNKSIIYTPEENQAVISKLPEDFLVVKIFSDLSKNKGIGDTFFVKEEKKLSDGYLLLLQPEDKKIKKVLLTLDKNKNITKIKIIDTENNMVIIEFDYFKCLQEGGDLSFSLPKDVDIIEY